MVLQGRLGGLFTTVAVAGAVFSISTAQAAAPEGVKWRDLSPWVYDALKIRQGLPAELDWNSLNAPSLDEINAKIDAGRPVLSGPEIKIETEHAVLHYTTEGEDAATQQQVDIAVASIERVWNYEVITLGYPAPPPDGAGGNDKYDFYFTSQKLTYGVTYGETRIDSNTMTSYIEVSTTLGQNLMDQEDIEVTIGHEFFHALHYTMDSLEEGWWFEVTATWMERFAYPEWDEYALYISDAFESPETPINDSSSIMYAYCIWGHSLSDNFTLQIIQDIWLRNSLSNTANALANNKALVEEKGKTWAWTIQNFRESMFDLSRFSLGDEFEPWVASGDAVDEVSMSLSVTKYPYDGTASVAPTGGYFVEFEATGSTPGQLTVNYSGGTSLVASLLAQKPDGTIVEVQTDTAVGAGGTFALSNFGGDWTRAVMIVTNTAISGSSVSFSFDAEVPEWAESGGCGSRTTGSRQPAAGFAGAMILGLGLLARRRRRS